MTFVEPITIKEAVDNVHRKNYLLPAIQREFVWDTDQIEKLFDSLMRSYPISSFLFWQVDRSNVTKFQFYEFLRDFHERDNCTTTKASVTNGDSIIAILDGQQRLTSLYIGLKGSYASKLRRKRRDNDAAFPKRMLYLNLLSPSEELELEYDFRFLTASDSEQRDENHFWFKVSNILDMVEASELGSYLIENLHGSDANKFKFANNTLFKLHDVIHRVRNINFFLEKGESLDKVLDIFIRVNSGGTPLSYSDLLLSIATLKWKDKDAKEEINDFVKEINLSAGGFDINKDFILKSCLVLCDFPEIAFKVDNFNQNNMRAIENKWDDITKAIRSAFLLISALGYHRDTVTSYNAVIPIAYYLLKIGSPDGFAESNKYDLDRKNVFRWLITVLLKRTFSGQPDNVLRPLRDVIKNSDIGFPLAAMIEKMKGTQKSLTFDDDEIANVLRYQYGESYTYSALALIYPSLIFRNKFHQDHIFPKSLFTNKKLQNLGIHPDKIPFYLDNYNRLANLQLLEGVPNQEKSGSLFSEWVDKAFTDKSSKKDYMERNYIPDVDLNIENFEEFIIKRQELIASAFKKMLQ